MNIGSMFERITIYTPASGSADAYGQITETFTSGSFWANVTRQRGSEKDEKSGAKYSYGRYDFVIRNYDDSVDETCNIVYRGDNYNVIFTELIPYTKRRYLKIIGERRPTNNG